MIDHWSDLSLKAPVPSGDFAWTVVWQSTFWLAIGLLAARIARRRAARAHLLLLLATSAAVISPLLTAAVRRMEWGVLPRRQTMPTRMAATDNLREFSTVSIASPAAEPDESPVKDRTLAMSESIANRHVEPVVATPADLPPIEAASAPAASPGTIQAAARLAAAIGACWMLVSLVLSIRLGASISASRRLVMQASDEKEPNLRSALRAAAESVGLRAEPFLRKSLSTRCPMIWCWGSRPVLLLPASAARQSRVNWRSVFCHELAHLVRRDHWTALWGEFLVIALPWQPLAWWTRRRLAFLREQACDDWVLAAGVEATDYAESLLDLVPQRSPTYALAAVSTRATLKRRLEHVLAGMQITPRVGRRWIAATSLLALAAIAGVGFAQQRRVAPVSGEQVDLGDITVDRHSKELRGPKVHRGPEKRKQARHTATMPAQNEARPNERPTATESRQNVSGRVVTEKGDGITGATVAVIVRRKAAHRVADLDPSGDVLGEATTAGDGRFQLWVPRINSSQLWFCSLIARANDRALTWRAVNVDGPPVVATLTLSNEQPVRGRFVDLQGQPLAGARARVQSVIPTVRDGSFLDGVGFMTSGAWPAAWPREVASDETGRFTLHGIGVGQGVLLQLEGSDKIAPQSVMLNTGLSEKREKHDGTYRPQAVRNLPPGEEAILPLAPPQILEGNVRLADTRQPAAHARLTVYASQQKIGGSYIGVPGRADAQGHYRINPQPGVQFQVTAYPPDGTPYLIRRTTHLWKSGDVRARVDVELPRGVLVRGTIVESESDRPISDCSIQYIPTAAAMRQAPEGVVTGWSGIETSDARGEFSISVLPGLGHLLVHGPTSEFVYQEIGGRELDRGRPGGQRHYGHAIERVEPKADSASPINLTLKLKRGVLVTGRLVTPDGRPVEEALMVSRLQIADFSPTWRAFPETLRRGTFAVSGCAADVEYPVYFLDQQHRLGATARLSANSQSAVVRMGPCGAAKARFIDTEGKPIADFHPSLYLVVTPGPSRFDSSPVSSGQLTADEDFVQNLDRKNQQSWSKSDASGFLTFKVLIPGAAYRVLGAKKGAIAVLKDFSAEPDKTVDLGDLLADRPQVR